MAIRLVVFDVVGTTVRDRHDAVRRSMYASLAARGLQLREGAMAGVTGFAKAEAIRTLLEGHGRDELLPDADAIHQDFVARVAQAYRAPDALQPIDGIEAAFAELRAAGVQLALETGFSREVLDQVLAQLHWAGADGPIDASIASDEVVRGRPYPDMIDALRARLGGIAYGEVAKIGDTPVDLQEGTMARCGLVAGVLSGRHTRDTLMQHPHDVLLGSAAELPAWLRDRGLLPGAQE